MPVKVPTQDDVRRKYIRELNSKYDREAVSMLCDIGIFATADDTCLDSIVYGLLDDDEDAVSDAICEAQDRVTRSGIESARREAILELEKLTSKRESDAIEAAYLLGVAVGRRIGPDALRGAR